MGEQIKDRANIPNSPACGQWETLLADALDGLLQPEDESTFSEHMANCVFCTELFEQARRGREWLEFLAPEPETPAYLLDRILLETGHGKLDPKKLVVAGGPAEAGNVLTMTPAWQRPGFAARMRRFAEPRLLMTAAMAFFSIALTLSMTGVRISSIRIVDLRPASVRFVLEKRIMTASTPLIRYYDHLRFVYEVESTVRELRRTTQGGTETEQPNQAPNQNKNQPDGESHRKDGGSRLIPGINPKNAPQQTVNPPALLRSDDMIEAQLEPLLSSQPGIHETFNERINERLNKRTNETTPEIKGFPIHTQASGSIESGFNEAVLIESDSIQISVLAMPERSIPCIA